MSARDDLYALAVCGDDRTADSRIDAYRDEVRNEQGPEDCETLAEAADAYRWLRPVIVDTMADSDRWDGDESEEFHLGRYVQWLAAEREQIRREVLTEAADMVDHAFHNEPFLSYPTDFADYLREAAGQNADGTPPPADGPTQPAIVCICGSTRFMAEMAEADLRETAAGRIVVKPGCNMKTPHPLWADPADAEALKVRLDDLHRAKIRMADEVLVVGDYIGDSTRAEIAYARSLGKPIRFTHPQVDPDRGLPPTGHCTRHAGAERELYGCSGPDPADASADRLPFLGDVDARAQASADKLRGLLGGAS